MTSIDLDPTFPGVTPGNVQSLAEGGCAGYCVQTTRYKGKKQYRNNDRIRIFKKPYLQTANQYF